MSFGLRRIAILTTLSGLPLLQSLNLSCRLAILEEATV
jgi:hypothetical protein